MIPKIKKASYLNITINTFLMLLNLVVGFFFSSISFISKGLESLQDVLTAIIIHFTIKINNKDKDQNHPFGHTRAENLAGYSIGMIMFILGFEVINYGINNFLNQKIIEFNSLLFLVVSIALILKLFLYVYIKNILKTNNSPALKANLQDHFNDILMYIGLFIGVFAIKFGFYIVDSIIAILIGIYIIYSGFDICRENLKYLMGTSAPKEIIKEIKNIARRVEGVLEINLCKTQYLGNKLQVEIHIALNENTNLHDSHEIANKVRENIKHREDVISCFVHIDPYIKIIDL